MRFEHFIDSSRAVVMNMSDVGGSEELRKCEIKFLDIEKNMTHYNLAAFENLPVMVTNEKIQRLFDPLKTDSKLGSGQLEQFRILQREYAARNKFRLEHNTNQ